LMREPRFIVRYLEVPADAQGAERAGVFIADPELDSAFALAEPVAHDDWVPENLQLGRYQRNPVRQALDRIRAALRPKLQDQPAVAGGGRFDGVAHIASLLGSLVAGHPDGTDLSAGEDDRGQGSTRGSDTPGGSGPTAESGAAGGSGTSGRRPGPMRPYGAGARLEMAERPRLLLAEGGKPAVEFDFDVHRSDPNQTVRVAAVPQVIVDGTHVETPEDAPTGAEVPQVLGWRDRQTDHLRERRTLVLDSDASLQWSVRLTQPPDTAVSVRLHIESEPVA
jgi:hypothetical protein